MQLPEAKDEQKELQKLKKFTEPVCSPDLSSSGGSFPELKGVSQLDEAIFYSKILCELTAPTGTGRFLLGKCYGPAMATLLSRVKVFLQDFSTCLLFILFPWYNHDITISASLCSLQTTGL